MKTKRQSPERGLRQALAVLLTLALAVGLVLSAPAPDGPAYGAPVPQAPGDSGEDAAPDTGDAAAAGGKITLNFARDSAGNPITDLDPEQTQVDLYRVAPAVKLSGYDAYAYCVDNTMPCYELIRAYLDDLQSAGWHSEALRAAPAGYPQTEGAGEWLLFYATGDVAVSEWQKLAELLAEYYLTSPDAGGGSLPSPDYSTVIGQSAAVPEGLYFATVHGKDMKPEDYIAVEHPLTATGYRQEKGRICTAAYSADKLCYFQPQLISLPNRGMDAAGNAVTDTTLPGEWFFDVTVITKGEALPRYADLEIVKRLENPGAEPAVFVFRVAAYAPEDTGRTNPIYQKVVTVPYNGTGEMDPVLLANVIPVGSTVVITEEYTGAGYVLSGADTEIRWNGEDHPSEPPAFPAQPVVDAAAGTVIITEIPAGGIHMETPSGGEHILPDGTVETVIFTNERGDAAPPHGGMVVNRFAYDTENKGWTWMKISVNKETGEWTETLAEPVEPETP